MRSDGRSDRCTQFLPLNDAGTYADTLSITIDLPHRHAHVFAYSRPNPDANVRPHDSSATMLPTTSPTYKPTASAPEGNVKFDINVGETTREEVLENLDNWKKAIAASFVDFGLEVDQSQIELILRYETQEPRMLKARKLGTSVVIEIVVYFYEEEDSPEMFSTAGTADLSSIRDLDFDDSVVFHLGTEGVTVASVTSSPQRKSFSRPWYNRIRSHGSQLFLCLPGYLQ
jgi:hypothetical protein